MFRQHRWPEPEWPPTEDALARAGDERLDDLRRRGDVLPGVREALTAVSLMTGWVSTVLTGNTMANARLRLSAFSLDLLLDLDVGAYSADAEDRPNLATVARERNARNRVCAVTPQSS